MSNKYKDAFYRLRSNLIQIANEYGITIYRLYYDAAKCYIRYGVTPNEYLGWRFYELSNLERSRFYTARDSNKWEKRLNDSNYADYFNKKQITNQIFKDFIKRNWLYTREASETDIKDFLQTYPKVIVKPVGLSSGRGIHVANNENFSQLRSGEFLLEEFIIQHPKMAELNRSSVNSIRIYTLSLTNKKSKFEDKSDNIIFLSASIRVGGVGSEVDNYHAGGVGYPIDIDTGVVSAAGTTISGEKVLFHPGNGVKIIGFEVPNWKELKEFVKRLDKVVPTARLIAWDIAILKDGFELIEANYNGDPGFMQAPTQTGKKRFITENY
ncbi:MAG: hypothetical protein HDR88_09965 [Bacteroides sp.]|nr:hypothetical protein [Bacteroides sp.]